MHFQRTCKVARWKLGWDSWQQLFMDGARWPALCQLNFVWHVQDWNDNCDDSKLFLRHKLNEVVGHRRIKVVSFTPRGNECT